MRDILVALRRMYHHLVHGGKATAHDVERFGGRPVTKETVAARIVELEYEQANEFYVNNENKECPFNDPKFYLEVSEPCPVCFDLGTGYGSDGVSRCAFGPVLNEKE